MKKGFIKRQTDLSLEELKKLFKKGKTIPCEDYIQSVNIPGTHVSSGLPDGLVISEIGAIFCNSEEGGEEESKTKALLFETIDKKRKKLKIAALYFLLRNIHKLNKEEKTKLNIFIKNNTEIVKIAQQIMDEEGHTIH